MVIKNPANRFCALCFLAILAGLSLVCGCDRKGLEVDRWLDGPGTGKTHVRNQPVPIRVFLSRESQAWIRSQGGDCEIWNLASDQSVARVSANHLVSVMIQNGQWRVQDEPGKSLIPEALPSSWKLEIRPLGQGVLSYGKEKPFRCRGLIRCIGESDGRFVLVNVVDMESYLKGVVGSEMYAYWHMAALRAQSIASRTYALYQMRGRGKDAEWDIGNTQSSQVYKGIDWESSRVSQSVEDTRGVVLAYGPSDREKLIPAYYSSICGGHTQDAQGVFGEDLVPLKGRECPYCQMTSRPDLYRWSTTIRKEDVNKQLLAKYPSLSELEGITDIQVLQRDDSGRILQVRLVGSKGKTRSLAGELFRLAVSSSDKPLLSSWYNLVDAGESWRFEDGHGWGHGAGLCQHGSQGMAKQGKDCIEILNYYYPEARLFRVY
jgi:stage II sporulation protein D